MSLSSVPPGEKKRSRASSWTSENMPRIVGQIAERLVKNKGKDKERDIESEEISIELPQRDSRVFGIRSSTRDSPVMSSASTASFSQPQTLTGLAGSKQGDNDDVQVTNGTLEGSDRGDSVVEIELLPHPDGGEDRVWTAEQDNNSMVEEDWSERMYEEGRETTRSPLGDELVLEISSSKSTRQGAGSKALPSLEHTTLSIHSPPSSPPPRPPRNRNPVPFATSAAGKGAYVGNVFITGGATVEGEGSSPGEKPEKRRSIQTIRRAMTKLGM